MDWYKIYGLGYEKCLALFPFGLCIYSHLPLYVVTSLDF